MPVVAQVVVGRGSLSTIGDSFFLRSQSPGPRSGSWEYRVLDRARSEPLEPIEGKYGDPRQPAALADAPPPAARG
jgi:hypothetical protein